MKKGFLFVLVLAITAMGIISTCSAQADPVTIELLFPSDGLDFSACSYFDPPVFQWQTNGIFKSIEIQFSKDNFISAPLKLKGKPSINQVASKTSWKKIFLLPGLSGGTVFWRVVGTNFDKSTVPSNISTFIIEEPQAIGNPKLSQTTVDSPLTISWENACNSKFKVWFGTDEAFSKKKSLSVSVPNPGAANTSFHKEVPAGTLRALLKLLGSGGSTLYWYVESWDPLKRHSATTLTPFNLQKPVAPLELEPYAYKAYLQQGGPLETIFTMKKPKGWEVIISGMCTTLAFLIRDPNDLLRQIFYFGSVRPVYLTQDQKDFDQGYCSVAPLYCPSWTDAPVVNPLTVDNFFSHWPEIASMHNATSFMAEFPRLQGLELVSVMSQSPMLPLTGAETALVRGAFTNGHPANPRAAQGQFLGTLVADPFGAGTGSGWMVFGATAPVGEFKGDIDKMVESLNAFTISDVYFNWCAVQMQQQWGAVAEIGETLREASDIIWEGWLSRTATQDIMAYQYDDMVRSVEKVWDPDTQTVYEFEAGWYDQYKLNPWLYNIPTLEPLPDDRLDLWEGTILDGPIFVYQ
jgi:hypothetical protein